MRSLAGVYVIVLLGTSLWGQESGNGGTQNCQNQAEGFTVPSCAPAVMAGRFSPSKMAQSYISLGNTSADKGDCDRAIENYDKAIRIDPNLAEAYFGRGACWDGKGEYEKAIADDNEAIRLNPKMAEAFNNRGIVRDQLGDYKRAIADYSQAIHFNPKLADAYYGRGTSWNGEDRYDKAIADYSEAIRLNPNYAFAFKARGAAWDAKGDYTKAIADYSQAIRIDPKYDRAYYCRGFTHFIHHHYLLAMTDFRVANELNPADAYSVIGLAMARMRSGDTNYAHLLDQGAVALADDWPMPAIRFYTGQLTADQLLAAARNPDEKKQQNHLCEAEFYLGEWQLLHGQRRSAIYNFKQAQSGCRHNYYQYLGAVEELKRISATEPDKVAH